MMKRLFTRFLLLLGALSGLVAAAGVADKGVELHCGSPLEGKVWAHWEETAKPWLGTQFLEQRLKVQGDSYVLYDLQTHLHNLVWMAARCGRQQRLLEIAEFLTPVYEHLEPLDETSKYLGWVCRGGLVCNDQNRLIDKEVSLVSLQGLGLLTTVAAALAPQRKAAGESPPFVLRTAEVAASHLLRLQTPALVALWERNQQLQAQELTPRTRSPGFADHWMWMLVIQSNLALIDARTGSTALAPQSRTTLAQAHKQLVSLFNTRIRYGATARSADFDSGFWRHHPNNRYAGYQGADPPARCRPGQEVPELLVNEKDHPPPASTGWDVSHSRRLVHVALAAEQARQAEVSQFGLTPIQQLPPDLRASLTEQLLRRVWNQSLDVPLFANYWSGDNGWYRVAYVNRTGRCYPGTPPYGLSSSILTGGFFALDTQNPELLTLVQSLLTFLGHEEGGSSNKVSQQYAAFSSKANSKHKALAEMNFWSSLISP